MNSQTGIPYPLWDSILRPVEAIFGVGNAVIVGGAVRDALLGLPSKDIDVFVPCPDFEHLEFRLNLGLPRDEFVKVRSWDPLYAHWFKGSDKSLLGVTTWEYHWVNEWEQGVETEVQIMAVAPAPIGMSFPEWVVSRADFGLCRAGYTIGQFVEGEGFTEDFEDKRLTLLRADTPDQHAASMRRFRRLSKKFPEYSFRDGRPAEQQGIVSL